MNKSCLRRILALQGRPVLRLFCIIVVAGLLGSLLPDTASAQVVPSRTYQLQEYRPIAPAPPSNADRVRLDVIKATNPYTGTVDRRVLESPNVPIRPWPSEGGVSASGNAISAPNQPVRPWPVQGGVTASGKAIKSPNQPIRQWDEPKSEGKPASQKPLRPFPSCP
jgi:hypothetical protein